MNFDATKKFEEAKAAAKLNDPKSMCELFDAASTKYYLDHTEKTFEELEAESFYTDLPNWSANCQGSEWESIEACIECAETGIDQILEEEKENKKEQIIAIAKENGMQYENDLQALNDGFVLYSTSITLNGDKYKVSCKFEKDVFDAIMKNGNGEEDLPWENVEFTIESFN